MSRAKEIGGCSGVLTFEPHPLKAVAPGVEISYLTTLQDRVRLIKEQGVDLVAVLHFTREISHMSPEEFINLLLDHINMVELRVGPDFALGYRRSGTIPVLAEIGERRGFTVHAIPPVKIEGKVVSSTEIRRLFSDGMVKEAARLLGRNPFLVGKVVSGFHRGRTIGVPTANLESSHNLIIPAEGVYAVYVYFDGQKWPGVVSIGRHPTFEDAGKRTVEAHILGFDGDLYDKVLQIEFIERLRDEKRFADVEHLVRQIHNDIEQAKVILGR